MKKLKDSHEFTKNLKKDKNYTIFEFKTQTLQISWNPSTTPVYTISIIVFTAVIATNILEINIQIAIINWITLVLLQIFIIGAERKNPRG